MRRTPGRTHPLVLLTTVLLTTVLLAGCSAAASPAAPALDVPRVPWLLAADARGAVVLDGTTGTLTGYGRGRGRVWTDRKAAGSALVVTCFGPCPQAAVSSAPDAGGLSAPPVRLGPGGGAVLALSDQPYARVLSARSRTDAVLEEGDRGGRSWLSVLAGGARTRIPVTGRGYLWSAAADGRTAVAYPAPDNAGGRAVHWFARTPAGWRLTGSQPHGGATNACPTGDGRVLLAGEHPVVVRPDAAAVPVADEARQAGDCAAGRQAMALVRRSIGTGGARSTVVRGLDAGGAVRWQRELPVEAAVTAHPTRPWIGIADGRSFVLVDARGATVWRRDGVRNATFTGEHELLALTASGRAEWWSTADLPGFPQTAP